MLSRFNISKLVFLIGCLMALPGRVMAWSEHPLMAYPALKAIPGIGELDPVEVRGIGRFLADNEKGIEAMLDDFDTWASTNLPYYPALPEQLRFRATGNPDDIVSRFLQAVRLNPGTRLKLYLHLLPSQPPGNRPLISPVNLTTLSDGGSLLKTNYVELAEGQLVSPFEVLVTATNEPDYGLDVGLFNNNGTPYGLLYGFGAQPFGDPSLEYGSQAPFHMGFFHEARIVNLLAPFLSRSLIEYRVSMFKKLSVLAFQNGEYYWGWRFMGWGMHYIGDLSMPYHAAALPGYSPLRMIWINFKALIGFPGAQNRAIRLVSNRHLVLEAFQRQILRQAYISRDTYHPLFQALANPTTLVPYSLTFPREVVAKEAAKRAKHLNREVINLLPDRLVNDPRFYTAGNDDMKRVLSLVREENGQGAINQLTRALIPIFSSFSMHKRSFYLAIKNEVNSR